MNAARRQSGGWSRGRFLLVAAVLFAGQAGLVVLFAERARPAPVAPARRAVVRLLGAPLDEEGLSKYIFAGDPTIFPSSSPHGFADQAWLRLPPRESDGQTNNSVPPSFLGFAASQLVQNRPPAGPLLDPIPFSLGGEAGQAQETPSPPALPDESRTESFFRIEGDLAGRLADAPVPLRAWAVNIVLSNTVVKFAVNRSGQVVSAGLWAGSGLAEADASAVAAVGVMRFSPERTGSNALRWDQATFYWKTIEPPPGATAPADALPAAPPAGPPP
ncbi:MAG: hypothetical protein ABSA47_08165 [Verrucomicrobiota bacterium]|jgi:hypothetical protein